MAANYALNHALKFGHDDFTVGIAVKYFSPEGQMLGWMVPYVCNGQPSGYVLLDFTQEDPVSEFSFNLGMNFGSNNSVMSVCADDCVIVESDLWDYNYVNMVDFVLPYAYIDGGKYCFESKADFMNNFYQVGIKDDEIATSDIRLLSTTKTNFVSVGRNMCLREWQRYACPCTLVLNILKQNNLTFGNSDKAIYQWFWREMVCCAGDDWDDSLDFEDVWAAVHNSDEKHRAQTLDNEFGDEFDGMHVIAGGCDESHIAPAIIKWCKEHGRTRASAVDGYTYYYYDLVTNGIANDCPTFMCFQVDYGVGTDNEGSYGHSVNIVGYVKAKSMNTELQNRNMLYCIVADGYTEGNYKYINFTHTKFSEKFKTNPYGHGYVYVCYLRNIYS